MAVNPRAVPPEIAEMVRRIEWLAVAEMLVLIHGQDRALVRLRAMGCPYVSATVGGEVESGGQD